MIYGLYLSAGGVLANAHRQDVIANNLANTETVGFKRDLALFQERSTAAQERPGSGPTNRVLEDLGGGMLVSPTVFDGGQGDTEATGGKLDVAIMGSGYFMVQETKGGADRYLTRNGQFMVDRQGYLVLANGEGQRVLDTRGRAIQIDPALADQTAIGSQGLVTQAGQPVASLALLDADASQLSKHGGTLWNCTDINRLPAAQGTIQSGSLERSNVDPATELAALMDTQRQLDANANMIRAQDQTLSRLVNDVGKIG